MLFPGTHPDAKRFVAACSILIMAAACGGGAGGKSFKTVPEMISAMQTGGVSCSNYSAGSEILTRENGTCDVGTETLDLSTFNNSDQMNQYVKIGSSLAGGVLLEGSTWLVLCDTQATCEKVKTAIGGTIK